MSSEKKEETNIEKQTPQLPTLQELGCQTIEELAAKEPEVKKFLNAYQKVVDQEAINKAALQKNALSNVAKFREETKKYLAALSGMKLPDCYIKTLAHYTEVLNAYRFERAIGKCQNCDFDIGVIAPIIMHPAVAAAPTAEQPPQEPQAEITTAAEEEKKVNIYYQEQGEKTAQQVAAAAEGPTDEQKAEDHDTESQQEQEQHMRKRIKSRI